jgi:hypothetical protein
MKPVAVIRNRGIRTNELVSSYAIHHIEDLEPDIGQDLSDMVFKHATKEKYRVVVE